ncbi:hypothetical protein ACFE04_029579 [Oxalis oulophora]
MLKTKRQRAEEEEMIKAKAILLIKQQQACVNSEFYCFHCSESISSRAEHHQHHKECKPDWNFECSQRGTFESSPEKLSDHKRDVCGYGKWQAARLEKKKKNAAVNSDLVQVIIRYRFIDNRFRVLAFTDDLKRIAAYKAVEFVESSMVIGLDTGSTAKHAVDRIGELLNLGKLTNIV